MESAQDIHTGEIVEAEALWSMVHVDKDRYICRGCGIKVSPASYQSHNVVRPYFAARRGEAHQLDCDVEGIAKLVKKARRARVTDPLEGFPASVPSRLVLRDERPVVEAGSDIIQPTSSGDGRRRTDGAADDASVKQRARVASTIRPICRTFINFPHDRDLPLAVPGINASMYKFAFKRLPWRGLAWYPEKKIMYAPMRWRKPIGSDDSLEIFLDAGERAADQQLTRGCRVQLQWRDWSKAKRNCIGHELEAARKEAIQAKEDGRRQEKAFLFFIGDQDAADPSLFHVNDHRLVCCLVDDIIYPDLGK